MCMTVLDFIFPTETKVKSGLNTKPLENFTGRGDFLTFYFFSFPLFLCKIARKFLISRHVRENPRPATVKYTDQQERTELVVIRVG